MIHCVACICTYFEAHLQVFGNHKVAVVVVLQVFSCEVDLSTVLTRILTTCYFLRYSKPTHVCGICVDCVHVCVCVCVCVGVCVCVYVCVRREDSFGMLLVGSQ